MLSKVKGFFKRNVKPVTISMSIAMLSILSSISCFAADDVDITSVLTTSINDLKSELLGYLAVIVPVAFAILISYLGVRKVIDWIKGFVGKS